jgi:hypothetical protein
MPVKKLPIVFAIPLLAMLATMGVFQVLRDSYTAEARLALHHTSADSVGDPVMLRRLDSMERPPAYREVLSLLQSDTALTLLGYHMTIVKLREESPWSENSPWEAINSPAWRADMREAFKGCLQQHRTPLDSGRFADSLGLLLQSLDGTPSQLRSHLIIRPIPGTAQIRIQADCDNPERSVLMVNRLGTSFVQYWEARQKRRLTDRLAGIVEEQRVREARIRAEEEVLRLARERLYSGTGTNDLMRMQERISHLEASKHLIERRIDQMESTLEKKREHQAPYQMVRVQHWQHPTENPSDPLRQELRESMARLSLIEQELMILKRKMREADSLELSTERTRLELAKAAYAQGQADWEFHQNALAHVAELLTFIPADRSRLPSPLASYSLTAMAGIASLLLWTLVLLQIGYLRWPVSTLPER